MHRITMRAPILLSTFCFCLLSPAIWADSPPEVTPVPEADFAKLVTDLGDPDFHVREAASQALGAKGEEARPALQKALGSTDLEVRSRAQALLDALDAKKKPAEPERDPQQLEIDQMMEQLRKAPRVQILRPGRMAIQMNINGRKIDQDDLDRLDAWKGIPIESLGVQAAACPEELAAQLRITGGVLIRKTEEDAPAGGLLKNDLILAAAGKEIPDPQALKDLAEASEGKPLELTVLRKGEKMTVTVTPRKAEKTPPSPSPVP